MKDLKNKTIKGFSWLISGKLVNIIFQTLIVAILARLITPEEFGLVGASLAIVGFAMLFSELGLGPALVQRPELNNRFINTAFTASLIIGIILTFIFYYTADLIGKFMNMAEIGPIIRLMSIIFLFESLKSVGMSLLQRDMNFKYITAISISSYVLGYGLVSIILASINLGVWALVIGNLTSSLFITILLFIKVKHKWKLTLHKFEFKELFKYSSGFTLARIASYVGNNGDNIIIGKLMGANILGYYSRGFVLLLRPVALIAGSITKALFPALSSIQHDNKRTKNIISKTIELLAVFSIPLTIFVYYYSKQIVFIFFGPNWEQVIPIIKILALSFNFRLGFRIFDTYLKSKGRVFILSLTQFLYAMLIIGSVYIFHKQGIEIVTLSIVFSIILNYTVLCSIVLVDLKMNILKFLKLHFKGGVWGLSILLGIILSNFLNEILSSSFWVSFAISLIVHILLIANLGLFIGHLFLPAEVNNEVLKIKRKIKIK